MSRKLTANLHDKKKEKKLKQAFKKQWNRIKNLKQALNHGSVLKKVQRLIKLNQKTCLKPYIDMKTKLRNKAKDDFDEYFLN